MRKILIALCFAAFYAPTGNAQPVVKVDERLELSGIAFRLAGAEEYVNNRIPQRYAEAIEEYFAPYANHPLIEHIREMRKEPYEVAYNAVPGTAQCMVIEKGKIKPRSEIVSLVASGDPRWTKENLTLYIELATDFYRKTRFHRFFESQKGLYNRAVGQMDSLLSDISSDWFESFFGKPLGNPTIYICLSYGNNNYSLPADYNYLDESRRNGIIMGCTAGNEGGSSISYSEWTLVKPVIVHEFCHNFSSDIIRQHFDGMKAAADSIFPYVKDRLAKVAYGDAETMLFEGLNELCVRMYQKECNPGWLKYDIARDEERGFVWMNRAVRFMDNFYADRKTYPTIAEFMPQIVGFVNYTADNMQTVMREFQNRHPYVVNVYPAPGTSVSPDINQIRIQFSQSMYTEAAGIFKCEQDVAYIPPNDCRWEDDRTFVIDLKEKLKPSTAYGFALPYFMFIDRETGHRLEKNFDVVFKTAEK